MPSACGRRGCHQPIMSELGALTAEPGYSGARLLAPLGAIAADLPQLGNTVAVTMNTASVMTRIGCYGAPQWPGEPLRCDPEWTCLRLHAPAIETALAVDRMPASRMPWSLQFFSDEGTILHKTFLTECSGDRTFTALVDRWRIVAPNVSAPPPAGTLPGPEGTSAAQIDSLFGDNGLARRAMLPGWGTETAWRSAPDRFLDALEMACDVRMPLIMAVGNAGAAQVHYGAPETVRRQGKFMLVASGCCSLSVDLSQIDEVWITRFDGDGRGGYMLELYDWRFHCVGQFAACSDDNLGLARYWEQLLLSLPRQRTASDHI